MSRQLRMGTISMDCSHVDRKGSEEFTCSWYFEADSVKECQEAGREHAQESGHSLDEVRGTRCLSFAEA